MNQWNQLAGDVAIAKTVSALESNNIKVIVVENGEEAKQKALELIPKGDEVMTMTSVTLDTIGLAQEINQSGLYDSVRIQLNVMDRATQGTDMQKLGAAPLWSVGSVHAVTEDGKVIIASNTGSQLPGYAYGSKNVIWVVGTQKIVKDLDEGFKRIYDYVLDLEAERARNAYGVAGSNVSKLLVFNKEPAANRITMILVKESLGY